MNVRSELAAALQAEGLDPVAVERVIRTALDEDLAFGPDVTTASTVPAEAVATGDVTPRSLGVLAGVHVAAAVFDLVGGPAVDVVVHEADGAVTEPGLPVLTVTGPTRSLLTAERTALNLVCHLSGIASLTRRWADAIEGTGAAVRDTRKTTPGLRALEKYAVRCGGGSNKRMGLYDVAMVKDNHKLAAGSLTAAVGSIRTTFPDVDVQVEVTTVAEAVEAVEVGARFLLCDNMSTELLTEAVAAARAATEDVIEIEATGGLTLEVAAAYARTGVDYLSVGGLTHSSPILDIALDLAD